MVVRQREAPRTAMAMEPALGEGFSAPCLCWQRKGHGHSLQIAWEAERFNIKRKKTEL